MNRALPLLLALTAACTPPIAGPVPVYEPDSSRLLDAPWPTDARVRDDGSIDMSGFPGADELPLLGTFLDLAEAEGGYGNNSPIYVRFREPIDLDLLPSAHLSTQDGSALMLVDIDPASPYWGERVPVQWQWWPQTTDFLPGNMLAVAPLWGYPLHPETTYALIVTTDIAAPNQRFAQVWNADHPDHEQFSELADALFFQHLQPRDVAVATVFTTGDPLREMKALADYTQHVLQPPSFDQAVSTIEVEHSNYRVFEGTYQGPVFQHGDRPYASEGGNFVFDDTGKPIVHSWDDMRMSVCTPTDLSNPPPGGWPVVLYAHGTFGNWRSFCNGESTLETAALFAEDGFIGIGIDQPLHGTRATEDTNVSLHWFNYLNPVAGRSNFRQSALDTIYLARALGQQQVTLAADTGEVIPLDPDELYFMGHSQGGISGAVALPWLGEDINAAVLSGAGGGLSITVIERKDPIDISEQIETLAGFDDNERLTELHPIIAVVQWLVETTDPLNYAPYYFHERGTWSTQRPMSVLITSGQFDEATPHRSASAMAAAAYAPPLDGGFDLPPVFGSRDLLPLQAPVEHNTLGYDGTPVTSVFSQWASGTHWVVFDEPDAARMYQRFLRTARDEESPVVLPQQ